MTRYTTYESSITGTYTEDGMKSLYEKEVDKKEYPTYDGWLHDMLRSGVFDKKEITDEDIENLKNKIKTIIEDNENPDEYGVIKMFVDYNEEIGDSALREISNLENAGDTFHEKLWEMELDSSIYYWNELECKIRNNLTPHEEFIFDEYDILDWVKENYSFQYDPKDFDKDVEVNIMLDTGNCNYDFTCDNILNYYSYGNREIDRDSSVLWLARQLKKVGKLRKAIKDYDSGNYENEDTFIKSVIQELENLPSHMATMTFLVRMGLLEFIKLRDFIALEKKLNDSYTYSDRKGTGYITVSKDTKCGLFDSWAGGGSILEIELPDDLKIPFKAIFCAEIETGKSMYGYSVDNVYGFLGSAWDGTVKEIHCMTEEEIKKSEEN